MLYIVYKILSENYDSVLIFKSVKFDIEYSVFLLNLLNYVR